MKHDDTARLARPLDGGNDALAGRSTLRGDLLRARGGLIALCATKLPSNLVILLAAIVMARFVSPTQQAVYALALFYVLFVVQALEIGADGALTYFGVSKDAVGAHTTVKLGSALILIAVSPVIAFGGFVASDMRAAILVLALVESLWLLYSTPKTILERTQQLWRLSLAELGAAVAGAVAGIAFAVAGAGTWALVAELGVWYLAQLASGILLTRRALSLRTSRQMLRAFLWRFGAPLWFTTTSLWLLSLDVFIIGQARGRGEVGLYAKAMQLVLTFGPVASGAIARLAGPLYARQQDDRRSVRVIYELILALKVYGLTPLYLLLAISTPLWYARILGERWAPGITIFQVLVLYMLARLFLDDQTYIMTFVNGTPGVAARFLIVYALATCALMALLIVWLGGLGAALGLTIGAAVFALILGAVNIRATRARCREPVLYAAAAVLTAIAVVWLIHRPFLQASAGKQAALLGLCLVLYLVTVRPWDRVRESLAAIARVEETVR